MDGFAAGLALDLVAVDGLFAVDALADPAVHRGLVRVLAVGTSTVLDPVGLEADLAVFR